MNKPRPSTPLRLTVIGLFAVLQAITMHLAIAQESERTPESTNALPDYVRHDLSSNFSRERLTPKFRASESGVPSVVGGSARPLHKAIVVPLVDEREVTRVRRFEELVRSDTRFREAVRDPQRVEFLGGRNALRSKDERGEEVVERAARLRFFAYEINRVVFVDVDTEGKVVNLRVRDADYQSPLSRGEVERAEALARGSTLAPKELSAFPIARALVRPPDENGARVAYVMFRNAKSRVWRYEAFVDLSKNEVRSIRQIK